MHQTFSRRGFLKTAAAAGLATAALPRMSWGQAAATDPPFKISLAEWSLHRTINSGKLTNMEFPEVTKKEFGIDAVEYVNQFFKDKAKDQEYLTELKQRCDDLEVRSVLIMCDGEGALGAPTEEGRQKTVDNHKRWVEAAKFLGCHSIRVNAQSEGSREEQHDRVVLGLTKLGEFADQYGINVIVENHGGLSSNGEWLAGVMKEVARPNVGTLPDFGNFGDYDRYKGVEELMPYAKSVSAKSHVFGDDGEEKEIDYDRMMKIVLDAGYHGYVGIEWEGSQPDEYAGIRLTKKLLERVRDSVS